MAKSKKQQIAAEGPWTPMPLAFLRSRACAELSPLGSKLLLDVHALLGPNAKGNGDLSLAPKRMAVRGWTSRSSLHAAVRELIDHGLLLQTRQGSRIDCNLFAITLYPLDCDLKKIEARPGCYLQSAYMGSGAALATPPTEGAEAHWRHPRKLKPQGVFVAPPRDKVSTKRPATGQKAEK